MLKPKVGDLVRLRPCVVSFVGADDFFKIGEANGTYLPPGIIEEILSRPFAVGDTVKSSHGTRGSIVALRTGQKDVEDSAWVLWENGVETITYLEHLYRIDKP